MKPLRIYLSIDPNYEQKHQILKIKKLIKAIATGILYNEIEKTIWVINFGERYFSKKQFCNNKKEKYND